MNSISKQIYETNKQHLKQEKKRENFKLKPNHDEDKLYKTFDEKLEKLKETNYKKQLPKLGAGGMNMEMVEPINNDMQRDNLLNGGNKKTEKPKPKPKRKEPIPVEGSVVVEVVGGGKKSNKWLDFVKTVMKDKNLKLKEALKYIKTNNLYKK